MPNHITSRLYIGVSRETVLTLPSPECCDDNGVAMVLPAVSLDVALTRAQEARAFLKGPNGDIDFNNIIPRPAIYRHIVAGNSTFKGKSMENYFRKEVPEDSVTIMPKDSNGDEYTMDGQYKVARRGFDVSEGCVELSRPTTLEEQQEMAKHGAANWYDWSCEHWGTKWNAYDIVVRAENVIEFQTAWSGVTDLIAELSLKFPDVVFGYMYADEDRGSNTGIGYILNGIAMMEYPASCSREAYELCFELGVADSEDYHLEDGTYVYNEEEE